LRKQNLSIYDIRDALTPQGHPLSLTAIHEVLRAEGFARLPRRRDEERPERPRPDRAAVADVRRFSVVPRRFAPAPGGLFVFVPWLVRLKFDELIETAGFPGTRMIPAAHAVRAALALKLTSTERRSHVMDLVFDDGLALWAGLNVLPKTTFLSQYSNRLGPRRLIALLDGWVKALRDHHVVPGQSFNLDFHSIPFFGADEFIEKHYVSRRSRRQKSVLAFLAQDGDTRVLCYCNADLRKARRPTRCSRSCASGPGRRANRRRTRSSTRSSPPTATWPRCTPRASPSSRCAVARRRCSARGRHVEHGSPPPANLPPQARAGSGTDSPAELADGGRVIDIYRARGE